MSAFEPLQKIDLMTFLPQSNNIEAQGDDHAAQEGPLCATGEFPRKLDVSSNETGVCFDFWRVCRARLFSFKMSVSATQVLVRHPEAASEKINGGSRGKKNVAQKRNEGMLMRCQFGGRRFSLRESACFRGAKDDRAVR
jgi:hypothetical protein